MIANHCHGMAAELLQYDKLCNPFALEDNMHCATNTTRQKATGIRRSYDTIYASSQSA
jgi:hypothetical protein